MKTDVSPATVHVVPTYEQMIRFHGNDWSREDHIFQLTTGHALESTEPLPEALVLENTKSKRWRLTKTLSIVIPVAPDRISQLRATLLALAQQDALSYLRDLIEIVIVIDGRDKNRMDLIGDAIPSWVPKFNDHPRIRVCELVKPKNGPNIARNVGVYYAEGDIVLFLDCDMLLKPNFLFEHMIRHEYLKNIALAGFRKDIDPADSWIDNFIKRKVAFEGNFEEAWPFRKTKINGGTIFKENDRNESLESTLVEPNNTSFFELTDSCKCIAEIEMQDPNATESYKRLTQSIFGTGCSSVARQHVIAIGGFQGEYAGWGMEDTDIGSRLLARGVRLIPCRFTLARHINNDKQRDKIKEKKELDRNKSRHAALMNEVFREDSRNVARMVEDLLAKEDLFPMYEIDLGGNYIPFRPSKAFLLSNPMSTPDQRVTLKSAVEILFDRANRRVVEFSRMFDSMNVKLPAIYNTDLRWTLMMEENAGGELVTVAARNTRDDRDRDWHLPLGTGVRGCLMMQINGAESEILQERKTDKQLQENESDTRRDESVIAHVARNEVHLIHYKPLEDKIKKAAFNLDGKQIEDTHDVAFYACYPIRVRTAPDRFRCVGVFSIHSDQDHLFPYFAFPLGTHTNDEFIMPKNGTDHVYWIPEHLPIREMSSNTGDNTLAVTQQQFLHLASSLFRDVRRHIEELVLQTIS